MIETKFTENFMKNVRKAIRIMKKAGKVPECIRMSPEAYKNHTGEYAQGHEMEEVYGIPVIVDDRLPWYKTIIEGKEELK